MARNILKATQVVSATVKPGTKLSKLSDGEGLFLFVAASKSGLLKSWRYEYRLPWKRGSVVLGRYPDMSLALAREKADEARRMVAADKDPAEEKKAAKVAKLATFGAIADEWLDARRAERDRGEITADTVEKLDWLAGFARGALGKRPVAEITPAMCRELITKIDASGRHDAARRVRATLSRIFAFAVATERATSDPAAALAKAGVLTKHTGGRFAAITKPEDFGALLRAIDGYTGAKETRLALRLLALTALRPGELRGLRWEWIGDDAISIPAGAMKMREAHFVPLSRQAQQIVAELREFVVGDFVFPSNRSVKRCMSEATMNAALRRLGYSKDEHVPHGFRSSFSSLANEAGNFPPDIIEAALAHSIGGVRGVYNRSKYLDDRRHLAQWWADRCDEMASETPAKPAPARKVAP